MSIFGAFFLLGIFFRIFKNAQTYFKTFQNVDFFWGNTINDQMAQGSNLAGTLHLVGRPNGTGINPAGRHKIAAFFWRVVSITLAGAQDSSHLAFFCAPPHDVSTRNTTQLFFSSASDELSITPTLASPVPFLLSASHHGSSVGEQTTLRSLPLLSLASLLLRPNSSKPEPWTR